MDFLKKAQAQMGNNAGGTTAGNPTTAQPGQPGGPAQGSGGGDFLDKGVDFLGKKASFAISGAR